MQISAHTSRPSKFQIGDRIKKCMRKCIQIAAPQHQEVVESATACFFGSTIISDRLLFDLPDFAMVVTSRLQFGHDDSRSIQRVAHSRWKWWPHGCKMQASDGQRGSSVMQIVQWKGSLGSCSSK